MNFLCIGRPSFSAGYTSKRMAYCGLKIGSLNEFFDGGLGGYLRRCIIPVEACGSRTNSFLQTDSFCKFPKQFCSLANQRQENPESRIGKVKEEGKGGSESNPLMPRMSCANKATEIRKQESDVGELTNIKEVNIINELHSTENKDYLVKYSDDQKSVVSGNFGIRNESINALDGRVNGGLGYVRGYLTSVGAESANKSVLKLCVSEHYSVLKNLFWRFFHSEGLLERKHGNRKEVPKGNNRKPESKEVRESTIYKVKEEEKGVSEFNPWMPGTSYAEKIVVEIEEVTDIKEGDIINLWDLLFSENRDYLVKCNGQKVKAEQLVGKAILLYFVPVCLDRNCSTEREWTTFLIDIYNDLLPNNDFEVIVVAVDDHCTESFLVSGRDPQKNFESIFARMPWTAIPFSDIASRKRIARKLSVSGGEFFCAVRGGKLLVSCSISLDSKGMVLKRNAGYLFGEYGTPGYPFTDERIKFLDSEDDAIAKQPSLESLLGSPERDYVISNKGDRVPIHTLKDKVVALYFYEDGLTNYKRPELTPQLEMAYKELAKNNENFEVVLLYLYDTRDTLFCTSEESFWNTFKTMPWLALPFKDSNHKKLKRIFGYPDDMDGPEKVPSLVIIGPNGEFVDPCGADILREFGTFAYPFTRKKVAKFESEMIKELKLEMLWDPNTGFRVTKDGLEIPFSQFAGKRLLIYFEMDDFDQRTDWEKLLMLKDLYLKMKGTDDEFEVIHIKDSSCTKEPYGQWVLPDYGELPWLVHYYDKGYSLPKELERSVFNFNCYRGQNTYRFCLLVAFDRDGSIVRKTFFPTFDDNEFPFYAGGPEKEYLKQLNHCFGWYYWDYMNLKHAVIYQRG